MDVHLTVGLFMRHPVLVAIQIARESGPQIAMSPPIGLFKEFGGIGGQNGLEVRIVGLSAISIHPLAL